MKSILKYLFGTLALLLFTIQDVCAMQKKEWHDDYYTNRLTKNADFIIVATSKGVVKLNKTDNTFYNASYEYSIDEYSRITAILAYGNDSLYYSDGYYGANLFDGNTTKRYFYPAPVSEIGDCSSYSLGLDSSNDIWINFRGYFSKPTEFNIFPINQPYKIHDAIYGAPTAVIMDMAFDSKGTLWMATYGLTTQVVCLQNQQNSPIDVISGKEKQATSIIVDFDDNIWVTSDDGIHCYNQETSTDNIITHTTYPQVPNEQFLANDIDSQGNIWFSSSTTLMKYDGEEFTTYTCPNYNEARSILCDGNIVWVLLKNDTLLKFESNEFETIDLSPAVTGIEESIAEVNKTKAFVTNEMLNIENAEGINSVVVYDAMGKVIASANANGATSTQIKLPSNTKGVLIVKVNNDVVKVMLN